MPVMPMYTPGFGEALSDAMDTYRGVKRQKMLDNLTAQAGADTHQHAIDEHLSSEIGNAVNYDFLPAGRSVPGLSIGARPPVSATPVAPSSPAGDNFAANLAASFAGTPLTQTPVDGGRPIQRHGVGRELVQAMAARGPTSSAPPATETNPGSEFQANFAAGQPSIPSQRITLSNGATVDPMAGFARQLFLDRAKKQIDTDEAIRLAGATGATGKNTAEATLANRHAGALMPGDPGYIDYMSRLEGSKALATLPADTQKAVTAGRISLENAIAEEDARAKHAALLQLGGQRFTAGQSELQRQFEGRQQQSRLAGEFFNRVGEIEQTRSGTPSHMFAHGPPTVAPSDQGGATPAISSEQKLWDDAVRLHGEAKVLKEYGPRPPS